MKKRDKSRKLRQKIKLFKRIIQGKYILNKNYRKLEIFNNYLKVVHWTSQQVSKTCFINYFLLFFQKRIFTFKNEPDCLKQNRRFLLKIIG